MDKWLDKCKLESNYLLSLKSEFVVNYMDSWLEVDTYYIQTELCDYTLRGIMNAKREVFDRQNKSKPMNIIEMFISIELLVEMLDCINYIHRQTPSIIHRDIKPENFLIKLVANGGHFVKLADFGSAIDHSSDSCHSLNVGTTMYSAPEILVGHYNTSADIYSMAIIVDELFDIMIVSEYAI
ncbi:cyclin-dependent kinase 2-like [Oppia nitens]|uniref:cyclin-dependent kinase 2-like n=1 Tax=Oppia nitens TaxID=1686743 RepID=UPI0023D979AB|nr:cyclin-dependent kinase 2-like [Oppia nitens]